MAGKTRTIYWDTSIFLAWFNGEATHGVNVTAGMREHRELFNQKRLNLATSAITLIEILDAKLNEETRGNFFAMRGRENFKLFSADSKVCWRASEIRNYYSGLQDNLPTVDTPDSLHLATATMIPNCSEFYTLDFRNREENIEKGTEGNRGLLRLTDYFEEQYGLKISRPLSEDMQLFDTSEEAGS